MTELLLMKRLILASLLALPLLAQDHSVPRKASDIGIQVAPEKYIWLSEYLGKTCVVAIIQTTCPHCQFTTGILNKMQTEYASRGVQVLATAIEPMSSLHIPDFQKNFKPQFPVGYNDQNYVMKFLGYPENEPMFVPQIVFVDRNGMVRVQFGGDDPAFNKDVQEKNIRDAIEKTLKEGSAVRK